MCGSRIELACGGAIRSFTESHWGFSERHRVPHPV
jgi:hypothetical protein